MPIYEYVCKKCKHKFEIFHRGGEREKIECPQCKGKEIEKLLSLFGFSSGGSFVSSASGGNACTSCSSKSCNGCGK
jgi:putative FmdB family regulatory protein